MTMCNTLRQIGGTAIVFGALALVPLTASAMVTKHAINPPTANPHWMTKSASQAKRSSNGDILVARVGYVNANGKSAESPPVTERSTHNSNFVLVPKVGYVNVKAPS